MKKGILCLMTVLALTVAFIPAASAHPIKPLRCEGTGYWDGSQWVGEITGDIEGSTVTTPAWAIFPGKTEHFGENWVISTDDGYEIEIYDIGVWSFVTYKFRANGRVTAASGPYAYLVGAKVHLMGMTTSLDADPIEIIKCTIRFN